MNSFRTREQSLEMLAAYDELAVDGLPLDFLQNTEPKLRADDLGPVSWPDDPDLEWCPPGHGDVYVALAASGVLDSPARKGLPLRLPVQLRQPRRHLRAGDAGLDGARGDPLRHRGLPAHPQRPQGRPPGSAPERRPARAARQRDGAPRARSTTSRTPTGTAVPRQQPLGRPRRAGARLAERDGILGLPIIVNRKTVDPTRRTSTPVIQIESAMGAAVEIFDGSRPCSCPQPVPAGEDHQRAAAAPLRPLRPRRGLRRGSTIDRTSRSSTSRALQAGRRFRRALPPGCAVAPRLLEPSGRGRRDLRCRHGVHGDVGVRRTRRATIPDGAPSRATSDRASAPSTPRPNPGPPSVLRSPELAGPSTPGPGPGRRRRRAGSTCPASTTPRWTGTPCARPTRRGDGGGPGRPAGGRGHRAGDTARHTLAAGRACGS